MDLPTALELTGERTLPGIERENYWFRRHEAVYRWVAAEIAPATDGPVLEAGSGEGYGAALLRSGTGRPVLAVDYDQASCQHAAQAYPDVAVVRANLAALPVRAGRFGLAVSLQVIEHLWDVAGFLATATSALRPGGALVVSTPNRLTFSPGVGRGQKPLNPFHVEEFDREQLVELLASAGLGRVRCLGLRHGRRLSEEDRERGGIVAAQVRAIVDDDWSADLGRRVAAVTTDDFDMGDPDDDCLDLVAVGVRP